MIGTQTNLSAPVELGNISPSFGDFIDASADMGWMRNPVPSWLRFMDREYARGKDLTRYIADPGMAALYNMMGVKTQKGPDELAPMVPKSQLNEIYGPDGLNFKEDERADVAEMIAKQKRRENAAAQTIARAEKMSTYGAGFATQMLAGFVDPLNIASAFIPVVGQARYASMVARSGVTVARAARGLAEGAVGAALVEPLVLRGALDEQADYDAMDSLLNIAFGSALGGGLHTGIGLFKDIRARKAGRLTEADIAKNLSLIEREIADRKPQHEVAVEFDAMPIERREALMRATIAQLEEGKTVHTAELHEATKAHADEPQILTRDSFVKTDDPVATVKRLAEEVNAAIAAGKEVTMRPTGLHVDGNRVVAIGQVDQTGPLDLQGKPVDMAPLMKGEAQVEIRARNEKPSQQWPREFVERNSRTESVRTADTGASKAADQTRAQAKEGDQHIAEMEAEAAEALAIAKELIDGAKLKIDMAKLTEAEDAALKTAKGDAQGYQVAAMCLLGL